MTTNNEELPALDKLLAAWPMDKDRKDQVRRFVADAVRGERERCAKLAENYAEDWRGESGFVPDCFETGRGIAIGIRNTTEPQGERVTEPTYPCIHPGCKVMRTKAEGGTTFTYCDDHWKVRYPETAPSDAASPVASAFPNAEEIAAKLEASKMPPGVNCETARERTLREANVALVGALEAMMTAFPEAECCRERKRMGSSCVHSKAQRALDKVKDVTR